ncbi:MAG TPA: DUF885 family protein [Caulobacteraceae bacterium]|jgi:uncharacterized protein (DUF885 family)|nr:DUF885 family protein [Caulobacteraceae bacterium]
MLDRRKMLAAGAGVAALGFAPGAIAQTMAEMQDGQLIKILNRQFDHELQLHPERATVLGLDKGANAKLRSKLDDYSLEGAETERNNSIENMNALKLFNRDLLSNTYAVSYDSALFRLELAQDADERFKYGGVGGHMAPYVLSQLNGAYYSVPDFLANNHKIENREDVDTYLQRLKGFAVALDQQTTYFNHDVGMGVTPPDFILAETIGNLKKLAGASASSSLLVRSVADRAKAKGLGDPEGQAAQIFSGEVVPALGRQIAALQAVQPHAVHDAGCWRLPDGDNYYDEALLSATTLKVTSDEIHTIGLKQVGDLQQALEPLLKAQGLTTGTVGERIAHLSADPKSVYPNTEAGREQLIAYLNSIVANIMPKLSRAFSTVPSAKLEIRRVPAYIEAGAPLGYYSAAPLDGSRPGIYFINLQDTANWPKWGLPTLTYHEGIPGHHFQRSYAHAEKDLPDFRKSASYPVYNEGWALYAEQLAGEMGLYPDDPDGRLGRIGMYQSLLFRACRLVVDSGVHFKRWSREQGIAYLVDNCGRTKGAATNEVERYAAWPGQACSYKIGHSVITAMRDKAQKDLGNGFDLKGFHDAVLKGGALPLSLLEKQVDAWVKRRGLGGA